MSMRKRSEPSSMPKTLFQSLGHGGKSGKASEKPKNLPESLMSTGGGKKPSGKGIHINSLDDVSTKVHIPSAGQMHKKVKAQISGQKKAKGY